jgi:sulfhydrogenase subunit beta (sulfur reductase)
MAHKVLISLESMAQVLESISRKLDLWIPAVSQGDGRVTEFLPYRSGMVPVLNRQSALPPKKVLAPQVETLLQFEYLKDADDPSKSTIRLEDEPTVHRTLVFGARPCDVRGFLTMDRVFKEGPYVDPYYGRRRANTFLATLVCREADGACFCSSVGGGPADMEGSDYRLTPVDGGYVVEVVNTEGEAPSLFDSIFDSAGCAPTENQEAQAREAVEKASLQRVGDLDLESAPQTFKQRFQDMGYWREVAERCLSCSICTFVCPTCYCFTITDETKDMRGERLRSWDSCMSYQYTSEASGHNPRPTRLERFRNRVGHKFSYIPEKYDGLIGCCGCGRCIRSCPVSVDIRKVVDGLKEEACVCA